MEVRYLLLVWLSLWIQAAKGQNEGSIRLINNGIVTLSTGRIQVWVDSQWGNVCGEKTTSLFSLEEGDVACRQLGYTGASSTSIESEDSYGVDTSPALADQFDCPIGGDELVLFQCSYSTLINDINCDDTNDVGISCYVNRLWDDPFPGMVRLPNGPLSSEGTLEVFCNGVWSTACGNSFTDNDGDSVCLQLGYSGASAVSTVSSLSFSHWFDSLSCSQPHSCISSCRSCPDLSSPPHSCATDAYIKCYYSLTSTEREGSTLYECTEGYYPRGEGAVRLTRGDLYSPDYTSGRVQVYHEGVWGNLCRMGGFDTNAADVICRQTGWAGSSSWSYSSVDDFSVDIRVAHFTDIVCDTALYMTIQQCSYSTSVDSQQCDHDEDVSVTCYTTRLWDNPFRGMLRLTGTNFVNEGRVEVYCNGQWGTICNLNFDADDRRVICQQLGYNKAFDTSELILSPVSSPVWLDNLACLSDDSYKCITDCQSCTTTSSTNPLCHTNTSTVEIQCYVDSQNDAVTQDFSNCQVTDSSISTSLEGAVIFHRQGLDSSSFSSGIVALYHNGDWGNICGHSGLSVTEADVICHQMTYTGSSSWSYDEDHDYGIDTRGPVITEMSCATGSELTALQCAYSDSSDISNTCVDSSDLVVTCYETRIWDNPFVGMVRLVGGDFTNEGRVEVYCSGEWGTMCGETFDLTSDGGAVCRQLGYSQATKVDYTSQLQANSTTPIWLDSLQCSDGLASCVGTCQACPSNGQLSNKCTHSSDATVQCSHSVSSSKQDSGLNGACMIDSLLPGVAQSGAITLGRNGDYSSSYTSGRVLVNHNGRWGTVCRRDTFSTTEADVMCNQLTYSGASGWSYAEDDSFGLDPLRNILKDVTCGNSDYLTVFQCSVSTTVTGCASTDAVSITCYTSRVWDNPFNTMIRLSNGNYTNEGLLEVYCNDQWGTVCNETFVTSSAGTAACRQLGYHSYTLVDRSSSILGSSDQPVWLDQLSCSAASPGCLMECQSCPTTGSTNSQCTHRQDVTIKCSVSRDLDEVTNGNRIESCLFKQNYLLYIIIGSVGGVVLVLAIIVGVVCCVRMQRDKGRCPKPCGNWEVEIDESNAGPLSLSMSQRHRRAPIVVPAYSADEPPPYDLTNAPDPNAPPTYDPTNAEQHLSESSVNPMNEEEQDEAAEGEEMDDGDIPELEGLDNICY